MRAPKPRRSCEHQSHGLVTVLPCGMGTYAVGCPRLNVYSQSVYIERSITANDFAKRTGNLIDRIYVQCFLSWQSHRRIALFSTL